jgi:competence ComEA-like helix-hairpin-helix protein
MSETEEDSVHHPVLWQIISWLKRNGDYCLIGFCGVFLTTCLLMSLLPPQAETFELTNSAPPDWVTAELSPKQDDWLQSGETSALSSAAEEESITPRKPTHLSKAKKKTPKSIPIININQASLALWSQLPGIGPKTAVRILQYKKANGNFHTPEDLLNVKGIGPKKFEKIRPYLKL